MMTLRVLVVDDAPANVVLATYLLEVAGCVVDSAENGLEAMAKVVNFRPDVVLMDVQMPDIDGLTVTGQIKADTNAHDIVVIAFTAYAMRGDEERAMAAGCDGYISKPIKTDSFAEQVCTIFEARMSQRNRTHPGDASQ